MTTMTPAQEALSDYAKAVGAAWFAHLIPGSTFHFHMVETRPSERDLAALDELLAAGIIERTACDPSGKVEYRPLVDCLPFAKWVSDLVKDQIGRASCRERVCQNVKISGVAVQ